MTRPTKRLLNHLLYLLVMTGLPVITYVVLVVFMGHDADSFYREMTAYLIICLFYLIVAISIFLYRRFIRRMLWK